MGIIRDPEQDEAINSNTCYIGNEKVYTKWADKAEGPGHIYSRAGQAEYQNSGACEYHFDKWFEEGSDPESGIFFVTSEEEEPLTPEEEEMAPPDAKLQPSYKVHGTITGRIPPVKSGDEQYCPDCGEFGEQKGHMECQSPQDLDDRLDGVMEDHYRYGVD